MFNSQSKFIYGPGFGVDWSINTNQILFWTINFNLTISNDTHYGDEIHIDIKTWKTSEDPYNELSPPSRLSSTDTPSVRPITWVIKQLRWILLRWKLSPWEVNTEFSQDTDWLLMPAKQRPGWSSSRIL